MSTLTKNQYGKQRVHVVKVDRSQEQHRVMDVVVRVLLTGKGLGDAYTKADNRMVVPTDTVKNVIYVVAKQSAMRSIEEYGMDLTAFFLKMYAHIDTVEARLEQNPWARAVVDGKPHPHSFVPIPCKYVAEVKQERGGKPHVTSSVRELMVMKTTGSGWADYHMCKFTSLAATGDRILKTAVRADWTYMPGANPDYNAVRAKVLDTINTIFSAKYSPGVQATQWEIGRAVLESVASVQDIYFEMPNQHNWEYDLARFGIPNNSEVYYPPVDPTGFITCTVSRNISSKL